MPRETMIAEATLRKAAILITSLDAEISDGLLKQMPSDQANRVREAAARLENVDDQERDRVIREFVERQRAPADPPRPPAPTTNAQPQGIKTAAATINRKFFGFLNDGPIESVVAFLPAEHPQTISAILAHLSPDRAAVILRALPTEQRAEVLTRLSRIDSTDPDVLADLHDELKFAFDRHLTEAARQREQFTTLAAIVRSVDGPARYDILGCLNENERCVVDELLHRRTRDDAVDNTANVDDGCEFPSAESGDDRSDVEPIEFDDLLGLDDHSLVKLFRAADGDVALLALTAASRELIDRVLRHLPPRQAKLFRQQLESIGPTPLSDLDRARQQILELAIEMADEGSIVWPASRRFSVAA